MSDTTAKCELLWQVLLEGISDFGEMGSFHVCFHIRAPHC